MSLTLTGGTVVTSLDPPAIVAADVEIGGDGRVVALGPPGRGGPVLDCSGCLVVPGNVCAHTHLYSCLARGMPYRLEPPRTFLQILQRVWWRLDRALDEESIRACALVGGMEALAAGTTCLIDHHASPNAVDGSLDVIAAALEEIGLRSILCYEVTDRDGPERAEAGLEENRRFLETAGRPLARGMVGAHAAFTLTPERLEACVELAGARETGLHVHVAEDAVDERASLARYGMPLEERLGAAGTFAPTTLMAHCVHLDRGGTAAVRESGTAVAHNPRSNMNNAVGRAPAESLGDRVALGTDGVSGDLFGEARAAYWRAREAGAGTGPERVLGWLANGARLAGERFGEPALGRIEPGAPADLVVLDYAPPTPLTAENLGGHLMFGITAAAVRDVLVAGEPVVTGRRLTRVDQDKIAAEAVPQAERLWARMEEIEPHPFDPLVAP